MPPKRLPAHLNMTATQSYHTAESDVEAIDVTSSGWAVVEAKFQELRALLSAPTTGLNASQAREDQKRAVSAAITKLLDRSQAECRRLLVSGNAKAAVEGGLKTLKLKEEYYGPGSLQLVPAYFHLARTNQFMDKFKRAEEFLSLAQYEVLRHPDADISLHAELHQTFGLLYASDGKLDAALKQLTCSTYYLSCMHGPEHILTSFGYFDIGNVFAAKSHMEHAMAFYDRVKKIWDAYLTENLQKALEAEGDGGETPESLGDENVQDAAKMLRGIVGLQTERYGQIHPAPAYGEHVLGMFLLWSGDSAGGFETLLRALEIYKRVVGERHPQCQGIRLLLVNHGFQVPEDTADALADDGAAVAQQQAPPQEHQEQRQPDEAQHHTDPEEERVPPPPAQAQAHETTSGDAAAASPAVEEAAAPPADVVSTTPLGGGEAPPAEAVEAPAQEAAAQEMAIAKPEAEAAAAEAPPTSEVPANSEATATEEALAVESNGTAGDAVAEAPAASADAPATDAPNAAPSAEDASTTPAAAAAPEVPAEPADANDVPQQDGEEPTAAEVAASASPPQDEEVPAAEEAADNAAPVNEGNAPTATSVAASGAEEAAASPAEDNAPPPQDAAAQPL
jgi:tetratricopeptide (TPR) repeat protein